MNTVEKYLIVNGRVTGYSIQDAIVAKSEKNLEWEEETETENILQPVRDRFVAQ
jgi:hypothetical protein